MVASGAAAADLAYAALKQCARRNYSNPPCHGGAVVSRILGEPARRAAWVGELAEMTRGIRQKRRMFATAVRESACTLNVDRLLDQHGMFSLLPLAPEQIDELRTEYGVYLVRDGRINLAGLRHDNLDYVVNSLRSVTG